MSYRENISYLVPRDPSIKCWEDRVKLSGSRSKNLIAKLGSHEFEETMGDNIKVYLRLKPSVSIENPYTVLNLTTLQTEAPKESVSYKNVTNGVGKLIHKFTFTSILDQSISQADLFKKCAVKNLEKFIGGQNYLLMAYGTTSAGKTFTMQGNVDQPGVIPRALDFVFSGLSNKIISACKHQPHQYNEIISLTDEEIKKKLSHKNFILSLDLTKCQKYPDSNHITLNTNSSSGYSEMYENVTFKEMQSNLTESVEFQLDSDLGEPKYGLWVSMIEIYNEQVYDLLEITTDNGGRTKLNFKSDESGNIFVKDLNYVNVSSGHEAFQILQFGRSNLHLAPTALNHRSSRSHCIFTITLAKFLNYDSSSCAILSRFSFCDLAGMERAKKTLNIKDRLIESKAINTSLSILVKCLITIKENQNSKEKKLIPYRESKLTKLFRDAVMGRENFSLIVNVTTEPCLFDETLSVLKFSAIAQKIVPQNVFIRPKIMKHIKKSRFSRLVTNCSYGSKTIDWDAPTIENVQIKEESTQEYEELQNIIEKLREDLIIEKKRCENIEITIREELTSKFSEILAKQRDSNQVLLENETERLKELYERKEQRLIKYYEILRKNKRKKLEDDDESDIKDLESKLKEAQIKIELLTNKNDALLEQMKNMTQEHNSVTLQNSELVFKVAEKDRILNEMARTIEAKAAGGNAFEAELRKQLEDCKTKISDYKVLLDEAASDHQGLEETNQYLRKENEYLEQCLTEDRDRVGDLKNEINELQRMLSHQRIKCEKLEETNEKLSSVLQENILGEDDKNLQIVNLKTEIQNIQEQLKSTLKRLSKSSAKIEQLEAEKATVEMNLESLNQKNIFLNNQLVMLQKDEKEKDIEVQKINDKLHFAVSEIQALTREKEVLENKCRELNTEIDILQKEIKELVVKTHPENGKKFASLKFRESADKSVDSFSEKGLNNCVTNLKTISSEETRVYETKENIEKDIDSNQKTRPHKEEVENGNQKIDSEKFNSPANDKIQQRKKQQITKMETIETEKSKEKKLNSVEDIFDNLFSENKVVFECEIPNDAMNEAEKLDTQKHGSEKNNNEEEDVRGKKSTDTEAAYPSNKTDECSDENINETPNKLIQRLDNLKLQQTQTKSLRKKVDLLEDTIHPSTIKKTNKGKKKNVKKQKENLDKEKEKENESENPSSKRGKCFRKLFTENDFDGFCDLNKSPLEEIPRLRPRK